MPFQVAARTLERLEWSQLTARWAQHARTPQGLAKLEGAPEALFEPTRAGVAARLAETAQAVAILAEDQVPPLSGIGDMSAWLDRLAKDGLLGGEELLTLARTLDAIRETVRFLANHAELAPDLADLGFVLVCHEDLAAAIHGSIDDEGEVRDAASRELAAARREVREITGSAKDRIERMLRTPELREVLQDDYYTVRGDRFVLPIRADFRGRVPGIVHDASASGTTVFIEPQALVDLNNRLKQAELTVLRETRRVLQALSERAAPAVPDLRADLEVLCQLDLAFARGRLARELDATEPALDDEGRFWLPLLRHPLLPADESVPNDVRLGDPEHVLVISGPNAGGKTVAMKAVALAALMARAGLFVAADDGARVAVVDRVLADIGDEQDIRQSLSTFSAHMANLARIVDVADPKSLVVLDEIGVGTDPGEGAALAQAVLETLADRGARVITTTHYNLLKEMADVDHRFANASVEFDAETLAPTYRLKLGSPGSSSATAVAARMGMADDVLDRARALLEREDRQLDRMLVELSTHRAALQREREEVAALREQGESVRDDYRAKLERLQERRDHLFESMRAELEDSFKQAHAEVAGVIRELQRKGSAQEAARAREKLLGLEDRAREAEQTQRGRAPAPETPRPALDWTRAQPGDPVSVPGGRTGTLQSLPDRRGRVVVQAGSARLTLKAEQVGPAAGGAGAAPKRVHHVEIPPAPRGAGGRLDVRGERVDAALARVEQALDDAARGGRPELVIVHGIGRGALQSAIREHLQRLPQVDHFEAGDPEAGGEGVTVAHLEPRT